MNRPNVIITSQRRMGHAGALADTPREVADKMSALRQAGATIALGAHLVGATTATWLQNVRPE